MGYNAYDEYGVPYFSGANTLFGRFGYTGQAWLPELKLWYYKARIYDPKLGRFMQTDPIHPFGGPNGYVYPTDPVNFTDPWGLAAIIITAPFLPRVEPRPPGDPYGGRNVGSGSSAAAAERRAELEACLQDPNCAVVTGRRPPKKGPSPTAPSPGGGPLPTLEKFGTCLVDQLGLQTALGAGTATAGIPEPGSKRFVTEGSSKGTSRLSEGLARLLPQKIGDTAFGRATGIKRIWTPRLGQLNRATPVVGRAIGRLIPVAGAAILVYDATKVAECTISE